MLGQKVRGASGEARGKRREGAKAEVKGEGITREREG